MEKDCAIFAEQSLRLRFAVRTPLVFTAARPASCLPVRLAALGSYRSEGSLIPSLRASKVVSDLPDHSSFVPSKNTSHAASYRPRIPNCFPPVILPY